MGRHWARRPIALAGDPPDAMNSVAESRNAATDSPQSVTRRGHQGMRFRPRERLLKGARNARRRNSALVHLRLADEEKLGVSVQLSHSPSQALGRLGASEVQQNRITSETQRPLRKVCS